MAATVCVAIVAIFFLKGNMMNDEGHGHITISVPQDWKVPLYPASQHLMIEDAILTNVFESLVQRGENGLILPLAAKSFKFSNDFTRIEFEIDTNKRFSDGTSLTSGDFKRSWEEGMKLQPNSANKNLNDIIAFIKGADDFSRTGSLSGVSAPNSETLVVEFSNPFRMALTHLTGARFAAFRATNGKFIGTGRYVFQELTDKQVVLVKNLFHGESTDFDEIRIVAPKDPLDSLSKGLIDVVAFNNKTSADIRNVDKTISVEDASLWFHLNGKPGRFFGDKKMRKAFQALVKQVIEKNKSVVDAIPRQFKVDFQAYLPLQAGRLPQSTVDSIISEGERYIPELIAISHNSPLKLAVSGSFVCVLPFLRDAGLVFENTEHTSGVSLLNELYNVHTFDVLAAGASVHTSDPDGIYHLLGSHGAITSPMIQRSHVADLLEQGRGLIYFDDIGTHYARVNEAILDEVPGVHIGFQSTNYLYRNDRIEVKQEYIERHFDFFWKIFQKNN
jgi:ABC-type transport system substrate-binding protein